MGIYPPIEVYNWATKETRSLAPLCMQPTTHLSNACQSREGTVQVI